jgi:hypothetical protein
VKCEECGRTTLLVYRAPLLGKASVCAECVREKYPQTVPVHLAGRLDLTPTWFVPSS